MGYYTNCWHVRRTLIWKSDRGRPGLQGLNTVPVSNADNVRHLPRTTTGAQHCLRGVIAAHAMHATAGRR
jgi:hypothetical protein